MEEEVGDGNMGNPNTPISRHASVTELTLDPDALREKYRVERDKRLRREGSAQYQQTDGEFSHYVEDPYIDEVIVREPLFDEVDAVVIGGGFGGMLAAVRLLETGISRVRIIEKGSGFGGTWY